MASTESTSALGILNRMVWMFIGPATLVLVAYGLATNPKGWLGTSGIVFLVTLLVVIAARSFDPHTSEGEPTTSAHLRRYSIITFGIGLAAWAVANMLGNHWPAS
jgi:hypothetical protein